MAKRREAEPLVKVTLNLFAADYERLQNLHATTGAARAIRALIRNYITKIDKASGAALVTEIDLEEMEVE